MMLASTSGTSCKCPAAPIFTSGHKPSHRRPLHAEASLQRPLPATWGTPTRQTLHKRYRTFSLHAVQTDIDINAFVEESKEARLEFLEHQALTHLQQAVDNFERPAFPCALIAGDVVILHLLSRLADGPGSSESLVSSGKVPIIFIDTFHLFDETHDFLARLQERYRFQAREFHAAGFADKADFKKTHGSDLVIRDIEEYDRLCKVEPFNRSLKELNVDCMINGRRRDHGFDRAHIEVFEAGTPVKCNPLAYWTFRDCWDYIESRGLEYHPLHDQGYPSVGDLHSTVPVPREKWFEYGGERSGRFQGLTNADGSVKTECGIHVGGSA